MIERRYQRRSCFDADACSDGCAVVTELIVLDDLRAPARVASSFERGSIGITSVPRFPGSRGDGDGLGVISRGNDDYAATDPPGEWRVRNSRRRDLECLRSGNSPHLKNAVMPAAASKPWERITGVRLAIFRMRSLAARISSNVTSWRMVSVAGMFIHQVHQRLACLKAFQILQESFYGKMNEVLHMVRRVR